MKRLLTAIILLLIGCSAFADPLHTAKSFGDHLSPPMSDYSVAYLSQIFGTVGDVLQGSGGQVLGKMFDIFNKGVMVIAAIYLIMTIVQAFLRAAYDGSFMGQNNNLMKVLLRIALGFALIIPASSTGYSAMQDLFMKIVVQGAGLADQTWNAALNYLQYGGTLFIPPSTLTVDSNIVSNWVSGVTYPNGPSTPKEMTLSPVTQIFQDEVCMLASSGEHGWEHQIQSQTRVGGSGINSSTVYYHPYFDSATGTVYFPGVGDSGSTPATSNSPIPQACGSAVSYYQQNETTITNEVDASAPSTSDGSNPYAAQEQSQLAAMQTYSFSALKQLVVSLLPAAQQFVNKEIPGQPDFTPNPTSDTDYITNNSKTMFASILGYANLITPLQNMLTLDQKQNGVANNANGPVATMESQGWIMAGSLYWNVENMNRVASTLSISSLNPAANPPSSEVWGNHGSILAQAGTEAYSGNAQDQYAGYAYQIGVLWNQYVGAQQSNVVNNNGSATSSTKGITSSMGATAATKLTSSVMGLSSSNYNPIAILMNLGGHLLTTVVGIWLGSIALSVGIAVAAGICNSTSPGGVVLNASLTWLKSIIMLITGMLVVPGAILSYYVPLYPFAVFTFAAIGWFILVIEGMAAAPLVCLGITHPEGHDFVGKGEQALMLLVSIFLRPALMIIGLIAAMVISFVAFRMLIIGYGTIMNSLSSASGALNSGFLTLINMAMVLIIFATFTMELIEQCYKMISALPNAVMAWIGAPAQGQDYAQMASAIKQGVSSGGGAVKEVGSSAFGGDAVQMGARTGKRIEEKKKANNGGNISRTT